MDSHSIWYRYCEEMWEVEQGKGLCHQGGQAGSGGFQRGAQGGSLQGSVMEEDFRGEGLDAMMSKDGTDQGGYWTKSVSVQWTSVI